MGVGVDEEDIVLKTIEPLDAGARGAHWDNIVESAQAQNVDIAEKYPISEEESVKEGMASESA